MTIAHAIPLVSIILPVYNGSKYLRGAICSVLSQTFADWELIIINDGSKDASESVILSFDDERIQYYTQANIGLAKTLNAGIAIARGKYIARQDQDDISRPTRIQKQVLFLEENPEIALLGTCADILVEDRPSSRALFHPLDDAEIKIGLLFDNFFVHSSVMIKKEMLLQVGGYCEDVSRQPPEDYELWSRVMRIGQLANLPEPLLLYREVGSSMSRSGKNPFTHKLAVISAENLAWASDLNPKNSDVLILANLMAGNYESVPRLSFKKSWKILNVAISGLCNKIYANPLVLDSSISRWRKKFVLRYLDYRIGGGAGAYLYGPLKNLVKKIALHQ